MALPQRFVHAVRSIIPADRFFDDPLRRLAYGTDASLYRLIPQLVLRVESEQEVVAILQEAQKDRVSVTFRAAGTSLSGQAVTDSVLLVLGDHWNHFDILDDAKKILLQPGIIGAQANAWLAPYGRKIGPDPASINACKIGGIVANNSSGMCCGTAQNTYHTLAGIRLVLADGSVLDTNDATSVDAFRKHQANLLDQLDNLAKKTKANDALAKLIQFKYRLKNTTGLSLNALVDYDDPIEILAHLMVGSEGTLGFISSVTYHTVEQHPYRASALVVFPTVESCCQAVTVLRPLPVSAVELLDRRSLRSVQDKPGMPSWVKDLSGEACALLIEANAADEACLLKNITQIQQALTQFTIEALVDFSQDPDVNEQLWAIRKGTFPAVGAVRDKGTTVIIEDVTFPLDQLAQGVNRLIQLFEKHDYHEAILFGHALDGNLHFVFTQAFDHPEQVQRYAAFMHDVTQLVAVEFKGALKAEHGTGRNMAPFVELEWGSEAYQLMWDIKRLLDPNGILNPDVVLSNNSEIHLQNFKPIPEADDQIDRCIECGFCEPVCPSNGLTLTPRQRIVIWRDIQARRRQGEDTSALEKDYQYLGMDTCAATGLCATRCPVGINTGEFVKAWRHQHAQPLEKRAQWVADHFSGTSSLGRLGLTVGALTEKTLGSGVLTKGIQWVMGHSPAEKYQIKKALPPISALPKTAPDTLSPHTAKSTSAQKVVYLSTCVSRTLGTYNDAMAPESLGEKTRSLLEKAGYEVIIPEQLDRLCCGQPFSSKGFPEQASQKQHELLQALWVSSEQGRYPVYCDTSPCSLQLKSGLEAYPGLALYDSIEFTHRFLLDRLDITPLTDKIALHVTCSTQRAGQAAMFTHIVKQCSHQVVIPHEVSCCGFAGDKGFSTPELNQHALRHLAQAVEGCVEGVSSSRTCEIGLTERSGIAYHHFVYLLDKVSRAKK